MTTKLITMNVLNIVEGIKLKKLKDLGFKDKHDILYYSIENTYVHIGNYFPDKGIVYVEWFQFIIENHREKLIHNKNRGPFYVYSFKNNSLIPKEHII